MKYKFQFNGTDYQYRNFFGNGLKMTIRKARGFNPEVKGRWTEVGDGIYELKPYEPTKFSVINFKAQMHSEGPSNFIVINYQPKLVFWILTIFLSLGVIVGVLGSASAADETNIGLALGIPILSFSVIFGIWWFIFKTYLKQMGKKIETKISNFK